MTPASPADEVSRRSGPKKRDSRLPRWTWALIVAGGVLAYVGTGTLLQGARFEADLDNMWQRPEGISPEIVAPYVLLVIPAVLGALWTREALRMVFQGIAREDPPAKIAKDIALYALSYVVLILAALTSRGRSTDY
jgi:hypothetical protein